MDKNVNMFPTDPPEQVTRGGLDQSSFLIKHKHYLCLVSHKSIVLWQLSHLLAQQNEKPLTPMEIERSRAIKKEI